MPSKWDDIKAFVNSSEGKAIISFILGKNSKEIGTWIQKFGKIIVENGTLSKAALAAVGKAGLKVAGLLAAVYIAKEDVRKSFTKVGKIWKREDLSIVEKVGRTWVETWPPVMFVNDLRDFWRWATGSKKKDSNEEKAIQGLRNRVLTPEERKDEFKQNHPNPGAGNAPVKPAASLEDIADKTGYSVEALKHMPTTEINRILKQREVEERMKHANDPAWYKAGKLNGIQYANEYNFDTKKGALAQSPLPTRVALHRVGLPSVASLRVILSMGRADQDLLENMFTDVTIKIKALNKNSALTTSWNKLTLFKLVHTMRVAYALWNIGKNCYKLVNEFSGSDLTLPYAYFAAMGMDIFTWQAARAQIQEDLKFIGGKMDTYIDFTKLDLFKRTEQLFTSGYADSKSLKGQSILFALDPNTQYYDFATGTWTALSSVPAFGVYATATGATYAAWKSLMNTIIDSLIGSNVVQDLLSCLRFVFGTGKTNLFDIPSPNDRLKFVWNSEVMAQIENSTPVKISSYTFTDNAAGDWTQDNFVQSGTTALPTKKIYNGHQTKISKDEQIVASRLMVAHLGSQTSDNYFGTEIPTMFSIVAVRETLISTVFKGLQLYSFYWNEDIQLYLSANTTTEQNKVENNFQKLAMLSSFDWAPILNINVVLGISGGSNTDTFGGVLIADWDNFAIAFDTSIDSSLTWMSYIRNGNYSLYSHISTRIDEILDAARTA